MTGGPGVALMRRRSRTLQRNQLSSLSKNLDRDRGGVVPILLAPRRKPHLSDDLLQPDNFDRPHPDTLPRRQTRMFPTFSK